MFTSQQPPAETYKSATPIVVWQGSAKHGGPLQAAELAVDDNAYSSLEAQAYNERHKPRQPAQTAASAIPPIQAKQQSRHEQRGSSQQ